MTLETILADPATVSNLYELVCSLNALQDRLSFDEQLRTIDAFVDTTSLPTFGGPEPRATHDIWSLNSEVFLRSNDVRWFLEYREDQGAGSSTPQPRRTER